MRVLRGSKLPPPGWEGRTKGIKHAWMEFDSLTHGIQSHYSRQVLLKIFILILLIADPSSEILGVNRQQIARFYKTCDGFNRKKKCGKEVLVTWQSQRDTWGHGILLHSFLTMAGFNYLVWRFLATVTQGGTSAHQVWTWEAGTSTSDSYKLSEQASWQRSQAMTPRRTGKV